MGKPKKPAEKKPAMPASTPTAENLRRTAGPGHSPLWDHWPLIKAMRKGHSTWAEIASAIEEASGKTLKVAPSTICNFCRRIEDRKRRGKRPFPVGYEEPPARPPATGTAKEILSHPSPAGRPTQGPQTQATPGETFDEKVDRYHAQRTSARKLKIADFDKPE